MYKIICCPFSVQNKKNLPLIELQMFHLLLYRFPAPRYNQLCDWRSGPTFLQ